MTSVQERSVACPDDKLVGSVVCWGEGGRAQSWELRLNFQGGRHSLVRGSLTPGWISLKVLQQLLIPREAQPPLEEGQHLRNPPLHEIPCQETDVEEPCSEKSSAIPNPGTKEGQAKHDDYPRNSQQGDLCLHIGSSDSLRNQGCSL